LTVTLADPGAAGSIVGSVAAPHGRLDVLVNAAGILRIAPMLQVTRADWTGPVGQSRAVFFLCQPGGLMLEAGVQAIVNVSSVHAVVFRARPPSPTPRPKRCGGHDPNDGF